jgi:hypothetical protein
MTTAAPLAAISPAHAADLNAGILNPARLYEPFVGNRSHAACSRELAALCSLVDPDGNPVRVTYVPTLSTWMFDVGNGHLMWTDTLQGETVSRWQAVCIVLHEKGHGLFTGRYDAPLDVRHSLFHTIMNACEDPRMESAMGKVVPAFDMIREIQHQHSFARRALTIQGQNPADVIPFEGRVALRLLAQVWDTEGSLPYMGDDAEAVAAESAADYFAATKAATTDEMVPYAYRIYERILRAQQEQPQQEQPQEPEGEGDDAPADEQQPGDPGEGETGDPDGEGTTTDPDGEGTGPDADGDADGEGDGGGSGDADPDGDGEGEGDDAPKDPARGGYGDHPGDVDPMTGEYTAGASQHAEAANMHARRDMQQEAHASQNDVADYCTDAKQYSDDSAEMKVGSQRLMRNLRRVLYENAAGTFIRGERRGRLDAGRVHRIRTGDMNVFRDRVGAEGITDWAIVVLMDLSDSTMGRRHGYASPYSAPSIRQSAVMLHDAARASHGVDFACAGYSQRLNFAIPFGAKRAVTGPRMAAHGPGGGTNETVALMWAMRQHAMRNAQGKIILVLTDGTPNDPDTCKRLAEEAREAGILTAGIGIGIDGPEYHPVRREAMPDTLPTVVPEVIKAMMRGES